MTVLNEILQNYYYICDGTHWGITCYVNSAELVKYKLLYTYCSGNVDWIPEEYRDELLVCIQQYYENICSSNPVEYLLWVMKSFDVLKLVSYYDEECSEYLARSYEFTDFNEMHKFILEHKQIQHCIKKVFGKFTDLNTKTNGPVLVAQLFDVNKDDCGNNVHALSVKDQIHLHNIFRQHKIAVFTDVQEVAMSLSCPSYLSVDEMVAAFAALLVKEIDITKQYTCLHDIVDCNNGEEVIKCLMFY